MHFVFIITKPTDNPLKIILKLNLFALNKVNLHSILSKGNNNCSVNFFFLLSKAKRKLDTLNKQ